MHHKWKGTIKRNKIECRSFVKMNQRTKKSGSQRRRRTRQRPRKGTKNRMIKEKRNRPKGLFTDVDCSFFRLDEWLRHRPPRPGLRTRFYSAFFFLSLLFVRFLGHSLIDVALFLQLVQYVYFYFVYFSFSLYVGLCMYCIYLFIHFVFVLYCAPFDIDGIRSVKVVWVFFFSLFFLCFYVIQSHRKCIGKKPKLW